MIDPDITPLVWFAGIPGRAFRITSVTPIDDTTHTYTIQDVTNPAVRLGNVAESRLTPISPEVTDPIIDALG